MVNSIDVDISTHLPKWAKPITQMSMFYDDALLRETLTQSLSDKSKPIAIMDCGSQLTDLLVEKIQKLGFQVMIFSPEKLPNPEVLKNEYGALIIS